MAATGERLDAALTEIVRYIEHPELHASSANERFGILQPDTEALIIDKARNGNEAAARWLIEEALLQRFNPTLAAKIFVPRLSTSTCCEAAPVAPIAARVEARAEKMQRPIGRHRVLSSTQSRKTPRHVGASARYR